MTKNIGFLLVLPLMQVCAWGQTAHHAPTGFSRLKQEVPTLETGAGFTVQMAEGTVGGGAFRPDPTNPNFLNKTFDVIPSSDINSWHALEVGRFYFGIAGAYVPGVNDIRAYNAGNWLQSSYLRIGTNALPVNDGSAGSNHSWINRSFSMDVVVDTYRRLDYQILTHNMLVGAGMDNGAEKALPNLMGQGYNSISVGRSDGGHSHGLSTVLGTGRVKPEIVVPTTATSWASPAAVSAGLLLRAVAENNVQLNAAADVRAIKALLFASASKFRFPNWQQTSTRPLDLQFGAGELNIYNAYQVLTGGRRQHGTTTHPNRGWDVANSANPGNRLYFFEVEEGHTHSRFSAALVWHRAVSAAFTGPVWNQTLNWTETLPNLDLRLHSATGTSLTGVVAESLSPQNNLEHLYLPNLPPGRYALEVISDTNNVSYSLAWHTVPNVEVQAPTPFITQGNDTLTFTFSRAGADLSTETKASYTMTGTTSPGVHYTPVPSGTLTFPVGEEVAELVVTLTNNAPPNGAIGVSLTQNDFAVAALNSEPMNTAFFASAFSQWISQFYDPDDWNVAAITGPEADPEGDGVNNLLEYALEGDPTTTSLDVMPEVSLQDGFLVLTYREVLGREDLVYEVGWSED
ncbi:MAG: hypothetical protein ACFCU3_05875, partial [Verrucomicrobiales bacterium]